MSPFLVETGFSGQNAFDHVEQAVSNPGDLHQLQNQALRRIREEKTARVKKGQKSNFRPYEEGQLVLAKNHQNKMPRFVGPYEVIKVKGGGLSYDLKPFDSARTFTRAAGDLKLYNARDPAQYPTHFAPQDSFDSETSSEGDYSPENHVYSPPSGSPDDPGQIGQNSKNVKIGPRSTRSHLAPGGGTDMPDNAINGESIALSGPTSSGSGMATEKNDHRLYTKPITFFSAKNFSGKPVPLCPTGHVGQNDMSCG